MLCPILRTLAAACSDGDPCLLVVRPALHQDRAWVAYLSSPPTSREAAYMATNVCLADDSGDYAWGQGEDASSALEDLRQTCASESNIAALDEYGY